MFNKHSLREPVLQLTRIHYALVAAYVALIIIYDSWNLITHDAVAWRWTAAGLFMVVNTICWYIVKSKFGNRAYRAVVITLVLAGISLAAFTVYWERGMASPSAILFMVPVVTSAILRSRTILLTTATLCSAAYTTAAVVYFNKYYGEGYRVQLYGTILFIGVLFYIIVSIIRSVMKVKN